MGRRANTGTRRTSVEHRRRRPVVAVLGVAVLVVSACGRHDFVPYAPTADLVPVLGGTTLKLGGDVAPELAYSTRCGERELLHFWHPGPNASEWRAVTQAGSDPDRSRIVSFATLRFGTRKELDDQLDRFRTVWTDECPDADTYVPHVPVTLDGLPDGAFSTHWPQENGDGYTSVIADRDRQIMMIVAWVERPEAVPTDAYVDVVNTAWSEFEDGNS